jgi:hypothetical protein
MGQEHEYSHLKMTQGSHIHIVICNYNVDVSLEKPLS